MTHSFLARRLVAGAIVAILFALVARAENWPQWRGARHDGASNETDLPAEWSKEKNIVWRTKLPGRAGSTPVVWNDRVFLTSADGDNLELVCLDTAGKILWERKVGSGDRSVRGDEGNSAAPSPSTDGEHVWAFMANGDLACFDFDGNKTWSLNVGERYEPLEIQFGLTSTPVLDGERLYLQLIHGSRTREGHNGRVVCLDKKTGKEIWSRRRESDAEDECKHSYASPVIYRDDQRAFLITHGADYVVGHDLNDGKELWRCGNLNPKGQYNFTLRLVASPAVGDGLIVVPSAKGGPVLGLRADIAGDVTNDAGALKWKLPRNTPDVPSPLVKDGLVYLCRENGVLMCLDAKSGENLYEKRLHNARHRASPVYADGKIYLTARDGVINVVRHGREFELLATNEMNEEMASSPAISGGRIYLRTFDALYAVGAK